MERAKQKEWISTLRGFAVLLVFLSHLDSECGATFKFILGRVGVVVFFLLSGYLAVDARNKRNSRQYVCNRLVRMYPVYWIILLLTFLTRNVLKTGTPISVAALLGNMTLFHQFVGIEEIIAASWMMPMQVCFFLAIGICGIGIFTGIYKIGNVRIDMKTLTLLILMIFAIVTSVIRNVTGLPFPTAFFLLIAVAFLGMNFYFDMGGGLGHPILIRLILFEVCLLISARLSYVDKFIAYMIAYNIGMLLFLAVFYVRSNLIFFNKLGEIGFAFFLGTKVPISIVKLYVDFSQSLLLQVVGWLVEFVLAVIFAWVLSRIIEKPLQKWANKVEKKL